MRPVLPALIAALLVPVSTASWSVDGSVEPDTPQDLASPHAWPGPPPGGAGADRVYFNVVAVNTLAPQRSETTGGPTSSLGVNPNAAPGSRIVPASMSFMAWLGAWRDCNRDGYVGMADGALWAYRSELLPDALTCPEGSVFHEEGWVFEFVWIHNVNPESKGVARPIRAHYDGKARVWGDFGRPGEPPTRLCEVTPTPRGTLRSTGGALAYAGCQTAYVATKAMTDADPDGSLGLRWDNPERPETDCDHALNRPTIWGDERCPGGTAPWRAGSGKPAFTVWDCTASKDDAWIDARDPTAPDGHHGEGQLNGTIYDPTGDDLSGNILGSPTIGWFFHPEHHNHTFAHLDDRDGSYAWFSRPAPKADHLADGSWYDALGEARGNRGCHGGDRGLLKDNQYLGHPHPLWATQPDSQPVRNLGLERPTESVPQDAKRGHDVTFKFEASGHTNRSASLLWTSAADPLDPYAGGALNHTPYAAGLTAGLHMRGGGWMSHNAYRPPAHKAGLLREDLGPASGTWLTFYAHVGPNVTPRFAVPAATGFYGSEACPQGFQDYVGPTRWDCEPSRWWNPAHGAPSAPPLSVKLGQPYHLRDVDCYDGRLTPDGAAHLGLAPFSDDRANACPP